MRCYFHTNTQHPSTPKVPKRFGPAVGPVIARESVLQSGLVLLGLKLWRCGPAWFMCSIEDSCSPVMCYTREFRMIRCATCTNSGTSCLSFSSSSLCCIDATKSSTSVLER